MTLKGSASQACAACKYQRRRCTSECPLAPYFPPDQPKVFQNAHRLFGVSNILKILKKIGPEQRATAMWSIIYEANQRARDPVRGCLGLICQLRNEIWQEEQEFLALQAQLELYRQQQQQQNGAVSQGLELVMAPPNGHVSAPVPLTQQEVCFNVDGRGTVVGANPAWMQYPCGGVDGGDGMAMIQQPCLVSGPPAPLDVQQEVAQDYDEMPFFDTMDDRQSYVDSKEAYDSSSEESALKETNQPSIDIFVDNDLRDAAAGLRLTSVN